jgi:hypothetical protein
LDACGSREGLDGSSSLNTAAAAAAFFVGIDTPLSLLVRLDLSVLSVVAPPATEDLDR